MAPRVAVPIAPAGPLPPTDASIQFDQGSARLSSPGDTATAAAVRGNDVVVLHGTAFNGRGYRVCGVRNKRGALCGRIGTCPFHSNRTAAAVAGAPAPALPGMHSGVGAAAGEGGGGRPGVGGGITVSSSAYTTRDGPSSAPRVNECSSGYPLATRPLPVAPQRSRFKRSWTREEHSKFLVALGRYGRGKWKEIAAFVGTRNGSQCQSHACKYFKRQAKGEEERKKASIHDMTEPVAIVNNAAAGATDVVGRRHEARRDSRRGESSAAFDKRQLAKALPNTTTAASAYGPVTTEDRDVHVPHEDAQLLLAGRDIVDAPELHSGCVSACSPEPRICVFVHLNGFNDNGLKVFLPYSMEREEFLASAAAELNVAARLTRVFTRSGTEIESLDSIMDSEELWLSTGEDFVYDIVGSHESQMVGSGDGLENQASPNADNTSGTEVNELADEERIPVVIYLNGTTLGGIGTVLPESMCMVEFLANVAVKLGVSAKLCRLFTRSGAEIESLDEICDGEHLWASDGQDFSCGV